MAIAASSIQVVGNALTKNDLGVNLLYYSNWQYETTTYDSASQSNVVQTISFNAFPQDIMNNEMVQGTISNVRSDCDLSATTNYYDYANAMFKLELDISRLNSNHNCSGRVIEDCNLFLMSCSTIIKILSFLYL
jgi:hypothetical protein